MASILIFVQEETTIKVIFQIVAFILKIAGRRNLPGVHRRGKAYCLAYIQKEQKVRNQDYSEKTAAAARRWLQAFREGKHSYTLQN